VFLETFGHNSVCGVGRPAHSRGRETRAQQADSTLPRSAQVSIPRSAGLHSALGRSPFRARQVSIPRSALVS